MRERVTRRELLGTGAAVTGALALGAGPGWAQRKPQLVRSARFPTGVIAAEPRLHGATLWTQLAPGDTPGLLELEVAADPGFRRVVHRERVGVAAGRDLTARALVSSRRLRPGERYWYRFDTRSGSSPVGRFTTRRPAGSRERVRIGFFSCQDFVAGHYTAHDALAREDCDLIVSLGDYIYETNGAGSVPGREDKTSTGESGECETLAEYRAKYRLYRSDRGLRAMHASAPFLATWDDHEVEDNYAGSGGGKTANLPVERRIPFGDRRRNGYTAFFEQMPLATFGSRQASRLFRRISFGGLVEVFVLDLRQYRDDQPCGDVPGAPCPTRTDRRTMLGAEQKRWLVRGLQRSPAAWKVLASSVEWMGWDSAPIGGPLNVDGWDGYAAERAEIGESILRSGVRDVTVLTGDVHHFAAGDVTTDGRITGRPFATEFVGGAITSGFLFGEANAVANANVATNPHMRYMEFARKGYGVMDVSASELRVRYRSPRTISQPDSPVDTIASFRVPRGTARVDRA